ncbi:efflux RND transporter permease subunit [Desulfosarcina sp.]|nr:efflux RND transporter permease subunit [Desulfosarcina sp.]
MQLRPLNVSEPSIVSIDPEDLPLKTLALYSDTLSAVELRKRAFRLREELKQIEGTSLIEIIGGRRREFQIFLDPQKMRDTKTSLNEINYALDNTSLLRDLGLIKTDDTYYHVEVQEQVLTVEDIEDIVIASNIGQQLRIGDVARVVEGEEEHEDFVRFDTKEHSYEDAVYVAISKKKGENIVSISKKIDAKVKEIQQLRDYVKDLTIDVVKDEGRVANEEISRLGMNLLQAIGIVFIVLFSFLNYRAAIMVALSIPMTLLTVFGIGNLCGYSINRITLFALILSLGLLVDSATVVVENIVKNKTRFPDLSKLELISRSVAEVGAGLFLSTLTTVLAFIPMTFVTGMMGPYMGALPFFVSTALIVSLVYSYTMNPWLASVFCREENVEVTTSKKGLLGKVGSAWLNGYNTILTKLLTTQKLRRQLLIGCFLLVLVLLSFPVMQLVRFRMLPKADREQVFVYLDLDRGTSIEQTHEATKNVIALLNKEPEITSIQSFVGAPPVLDFNGLFRGVSNRGETHQATLKLNLTHPHLRPMPSEELAVLYRQVVKKAVRDYPDARFQIIEDPPGPPVRSTFLINIKSSSNELLRTVSDDLMTHIKTVKGVADVDVSLLEQNNKYVLSIDKKEAARSKVSVDAIAQELETIFTGKIIGVYHSDYNYEQEYITLKFERDMRKDISQLEHVFVVNDIGNHVPLSQFVKVAEGDQDDVIRNDNREQVAYISGEMEKRSVTYAVIDLLKNLYKYEIPGHTIERQGFSLLRADYLVDGKDALGIEFDGEWELTVKVFRDLGTAMAVAIIFIYLVLVAQFKSFLIPLLILGTIPLAMIGIIPGFTLLFFVKRIYFSATSMIGVIALAGIVVNNAIIYLEYALQTATRYGTLKETLLDAGRTRLRPIMVTSVTTVLGSLVIAADPVWSGLAWSIVFGLSLSSLLTLIVFPTLLCECLGEKWFRSLKEEKI